tara:strand:- start:549 stop:833 length:285 start_codon:yes stop_codon:yes gene_type:complete
MPTYDYKCRKCNHAFEEFLPMHKCNAPTEMPCPECKCKECVDKAFSTPGLHLDRRTNDVTKNKDPQFKEAMERVSKAAGVKGTKYEREIKGKYL